MGGDARSGKYRGNDGAGAGNRDYIAAFVLWWHEYGVYCVFAWPNFATFVLYWKRGTK